jgi:DNA-directed RNA polymerase subunit RPC12/RpoP
MTTRTDLTVEIRAKRAKAKTGKVANMHSHGTFTKGAKKGEAARHAHAASMNADWHLAAHCDDVTKPHHEWVLARAARSAKLASTAPRDEQAKRASAKTKAPLKPVPASTVYLRDEQANETNPSLTEVQRATLLLVTFAPYLTASEISRLVGVSREATRQTLLRYAADVKIQRYQPVKARARCSGCGKEFERREDRSVTRDVVCRECQQRTDIVVECALCGTKVGKGMRCPECLATWPRQRRHRRRGGAASTFMETTPGVGNLDKAASSVVEKGG